MANFDNTRAVSHPIPSEAGSENLLRPLKNLLQARFPSVKSSHLTEAIAAGLGHKTLAAFVANPPFPSPLRSFLLHKSFEPEPFRQRLIGFGYPLQEDLQFGVEEFAPVPPKQYLDWLNELRQLERNPERVWPRIRVLRKSCADMFANTFSLGRLEDRDDKTVKVRWSAGVDHGACLPNWGAVLNAAHRIWVEFPGTDHPSRFYQDLPLSNGKIAQYLSAVVSMPYTGPGGSARGMDESAALAGRIGWTCSVHRDWSWLHQGKPLWSCLNALRRLPCYFIHGRGHSSGG
jgi:hypothetical protein